MPQKAWFAMRVGGAKIDIVTPDIRARERKTTMANRNTVVGITPGSRAKIRRFYEEVDRSLAAWERAMFPRKKRRRKHGKRGRRHGGCILLLKIPAGNEVHHG